MPDRIANIGARGARRRLTGGAVWAALSIVGLIVLLDAHATRWSRAWLVIPFALAATGYFQARDKT